MKKYIILLSLLALVGCDAPQRTRAPSTYVNGNSLGNPSNTSGNFTSSGSGSGQMTTGSSTGGGSVTAPGYTHCDVTQNKYHTIDLGYFGLCQNSQDETEIKFQTSIGSSSVRVCLIPTYKDASGSSTWLGQPQCTYTSAGQVLTGKLFKDRSGFSSYPLNGVIVMKEPLLPEYFNCMQAYVNWPGNICNGPANSYCSYWIPRCPSGSRTNAACDAEGRNYMANICNQFKTQYSNSYVDIKLK